MERQNRIEILQQETQNFLFAILYHNQIDLTILAEDAAWFVSTGEAPLKKAEIPRYLNENSIDPTMETPRISFSLSEWLGNECVSLMGEILYHGVSKPDRMICISFHADWVLTEDDWKVKLLFTSAQKMEKDWRTTASGTRIDGRLLLKSIPIGIVCCDLNHSLTVQLLNENMLALLGFESISEFRNLMGSSLLSVVHPEDIPALMEYLDRIQGSLVRVEDYVAFRIRKKDFSYLWIQGLGMIAEERWLVLACTDYTDHRSRLELVEQEKKEMHELQENYRVMIENLPSGFHVCALFDPVHVDYVSDGFCKMTGYSQHDIHEKMRSVYVAMVVEEDHHLIAEAVKSLMQYPHTETVRYRIRKKDGSILPVLDKMRSTRDRDGKMWGYSVVVDLEENSSTVPAIQAEQKEIYKSVTSSAGKPRVEIHTFGYFEVLIDGNPVAFRSAKARELLAFLVDRRGNYVSRESIITALWENETVNPVTVTRCRKTYKNLLDELKVFGIDHIVSTENNMRRLVKNSVSCDLYDYLDKVPGAENLFNGSYLSEYSWSEITLSTLLMDT